MKVLGSHGRWGHDFPEIFPKATTSQLHSNPPLPGLPPPCASPGRWVVRARCGAASRDARRTNSGPSGVWRRPAQLVIWVFPQTHRIHVWYIYLHLVDFYGKCRQIYHTWILWEMVVPPFHTPKWSFLDRKNPMGLLGKTHHFRKPPNMNNGAPDFRLLRVSRVSSWTYHKWKKLYTGLQ